MFSDNEVIVLAFMQYQYSTLLSLNRFASIMMNKFYNKVSLEKESIL